MKKLIIFVSVLILAGCSGDGSNTTAGAGSAADSVAFGKFKPGSAISSNGVKLTCKHSNPPDYTIPAEGDSGTVYFDCNAHSREGILYVSMVWGPLGYPWACLPFYRHEALTAVPSNLINVPINDQGPVPKSVKFSCFGQQRSQGILIRPLVLNKTDTGYSLSTFSIRTDNWPDIQVTSP